MITRKNFLDLEKMSQANSDLDLNAVETELMKGISSVTRQIGESLNGGNKKRKQVKFSEKTNILNPWYTHAHGSGGKNCSLFGKFGVHCFL